MQVEIIGVALFAIWLAMVPPKAVWAQAKGIAAKKAGDEQPQTAGSEGAVFRLGKLERPRGRIASIPVYYYGNRHTRGAGSFKMELLIPRGPWIFQTAEAPKSSGWKISSKEKSSEKGATVVELDISGDRPFQDGVLGYVTFQVEPAGSEPPVGLAVRYIEASAPQSGPARSGSAPANANPQGPSGEPPPNPVVGCFFFAH
jgi:hypothetical protein